MLQTDKNKLKKQKNYYHLRNVSDTNYRENKIICKNTTNSIIGSISCLGCAYSIMKKVKSLIQM